MLGSVWSIEVLFWEENFVKSYCFISFAFQLNGCGREYFVGNDVSVPCDQVVGAVILCYSVVFAVNFVHDRPWDVQVFVYVCDWEEEIAGVGEAVAAWM